MRGEGEEKDKRELLEKTFNKLRYRIATSIAREHGSVLNWLELVNRFPVDPTTQTETTSIDGQDHDHQTDTMPVEHEPTTTVDRVDNVVGDDSSDTSHPSSSESDSDTARRERHPAVSPDRESSTRSDESSESSEDEQSASSSDNERIERSSEPEPGGTDISTRRRVTGAFGPSRTHVERQNY